LEVKRKTLHQVGGDAEIGYEDENATGFDRLVVRE
jgi:hypothetical protein